MSLSLFPASLLLVAVLEVILSSWFDKGPRSIRGESRCSWEVFGIGGGVGGSPGEDAGQEALTGGRPRTRRQPADSPVGPPGTCAPPAAPGPAAFVSPAVSSPQPAAVPAAGLRGSWEPGSPAGWPLGVSRAAAAGSSGCLPENSPFSGASLPARPQPERQRGCGLLRQFASIPRRPPSSVKEPLPNADIIQNKNFIFFLFCFSECEQQGM